MAGGNFDLSSISDTLVDLLTDATLNSPMWKPPRGTGTIDFFHIGVSGSAPETVRDGGDTDCQLSVYLMHVAQDPTYRNTPVTGPRGLVNAQQPLGLSLSFLVTAYAGKNFINEQQAMSIALACFHDRPIYKEPGTEFTITLQPDTLEDMSRLWQSFTAAYRFSAIFRVAVAFLGPRDQPPPTAAPPHRIDLVVGAPAAPLSVQPQLFQAATRIDLTIPGGATDPGAVTATLAPDVAVAGQRLFIGGAGLGLPAAADIYLTTLDGVTEVKITTWRSRPASASQIVLALPAAYGAAPVATPAPGVYLLTVGTDAPARRSLPIPIPIGARIDGLTDPPELMPGGTGVFTISGAGFTTGAVQLILDTVPLTLTGGGAAPGKFAVNAGGTAITFKLPAGLSPGRYHVRVRVNGVESPPSWQVVVP